MLPKTYALAYADRVALIIAPILRVIIVLLNPITVTIEYIVRMFLKMTPSKLDDEANILAAHEEIRGTIELQKIDGSVATTPTCSAACSICATAGADIMVHRTKMETINADDTAQTVLDDVAQPVHARPDLEGRPGKHRRRVAYEGFVRWARARVGRQQARPPGSPQPWFVPDDVVKTSSTSF